MNNKKIYKTLLLSLLSIIGVFVLIFGLYVSNYYKSDETANNMINTASNIEKNNDYVTFKSKNNSDVGIIFYPGAKVEYTAYAPLLEKLTDVSTIYSVKMPFNLAIFDKNAADNIIKEHPEIKKWIVAGHSMGGSMASSYASNNKDKISAVILLGAYPYGDYPLTNTLTIYGSLNTSVEKKINYTENVIKIEGGNHAQFGNYGEQRDDSKATISSDEQQTKAAEAIKEFIKNKLN